MAIFIYIWYLSSLPAALVRLFKVEQTVPEGITQNDYTGCSFCHCCKWGTSKLYKPRQAKTITCRFLNTMEKGILISCWSMQISLLSLQDAVPDFFKCDVWFCQDVLLPQLQAWWSGQLLPSPAGTDGKLCWKAVKQSLAEHIARLAGGIRKGWPCTEICPTATSNPCHHSCLPPSTRLKGQCYILFVKFKNGQCYL